MKKIVSWLKVAITHGLNKLKELLKEQERAPNINIVLMSKYLLIAAILFEPVYFLIVKIAYVAICLWALGLFLRFVISGTKKEVLVPN